MEMKYYLKITMAGGFPNSPDTDTMEIDSDEYYRLLKRFLESDKSSIGIASEEFVLP